RSNRLGSSPQRRAQQDPTNPEDRRNSHPLLHSGKLYRSALRQKIGQDNLLHEWVVPAMAGMIEKQQALNSKLPDRSPSCREIGRVQLEQVTSAERPFPLFGRLDSHLFLLLFSLLPARTGVVFRHGFTENVGLFAEIFLKYGSILVNDEGHHARRSVFRRIGHESEALGHFAIHQVTLRAAASILSLTRQDVEIVAPVRSRSEDLALGKPLSNGRRHQGPDGTLRLAFRSFPIKAIFPPFIAKDFLSVLVVLRPVFLLRRHQFLANADSR